MGKIECKLDTVRERDMEETQDCLVIFWDGNKAFYEKVYDTKPEEAPEKAINSLLMVKDFDPDYVSTLEVKQVIKA